MSSNPLVSVILPAFNTERFVYAAVRSVLTQTLANLELIVVDDCSSDRTVAEVERSASGDPRLRLILLPVNSGPAAARNIAIGAAHGQWIALLDADDQFLPQRLERLLTLAQELKADLIADNLCVRSERNSAIYSSQFFDHLITRRSAINTAAFVSSDRPHRGVKAPGFMKPIIRRDFLVAQGIRYREQFRNGEDFDFYVRCLLSGGQLFCIPESYYLYLVREDSLCRTQPSSPLQFISANDQLQAIAESLADPGAIAALRRRRKDLLKWATYLALLDHLRAKRWTALVQEFLKAPTIPYTVGRVGAAALRRCPGFQKLQSLPCNIQDF